MSFTSQTFSATSAEPISLENPLAALVSVNRHFAPSENFDTSIRNVNFMGYELSALCQNKNCKTSFETLTRFTFETKSFKVNSDLFLMHEVLAARAGCGISLALLYIHLGQNLNLKLQLVHWPMHAILKWDDDGQSRYIDLEQDGKILCEEELLQMVNKHKDQVRTLTLSEAVVQYLAYISVAYRQREDEENLHRALSLILKLEPENTRYLAERALLRKKLGLLKESLSDFKRYFSFTEMQSAPGEVSSAYEELRHFSNTLS